MLQVQKYETKGHTANYTSLLFDKRQNFCYKKNSFVLKERFVFLDFIFR